MRPALLLFRPINIAVLLVIVAWSGEGLAVEPRATIDFARDIQPIFQEHCLKCHGGVKREGGLTLLAPHDAAALGDAAIRTIVPGKPEQSELMRRVTTTDPDERMPADAPALPADQIDRLRRWIEEGASWPRHWSFKPLAQPAVPDVKNASWVRNPIDRFVLARLETVGAEGIEPSPEADAYTLVRRLYLDLIGLPPPQEEVEALLTDSTGEAYEKLVDRLMASPHFGERWGRHWLDLARYADSDGYEVDKPRPDAWLWRDWVIDAINRDLPLDRFTLEQFAGDSLPDATPREHLATAYHRQTLTNNEGGVDKEEYRLKAVTDRVSNMGTVWLGLTLGCAQCHDHPYDPFTQREFYELAAIFNNADETEIEWQGAPPGSPKKVRVLSERSEPRVTRLLKRGDFLQPGEEVQPGLPNSLHVQSAAVDGAGSSTPRVELPDSAGQATSASTQRDRPNRLDLARRLVDKSNPLTPRVMANHLWLHLFGRGLVRTPDDFGERGEPPTHPELLDWLAGELNTSQSRKQMIRLIVTSATYRQASRYRPDMEQIDPQNRLLWRQNRFRVEAEIVRDLHLAAARLLSPRIGGPSVFPPLPAELVKITFRSELPWKTSEGEDRYRRGMYTFFKRTVPYPTLMLFDCPDSYAAAVERGVSNTPLQALTTLNNETFIEAARGLARRMLSAAPASDSERIAHAFRLCLARPPSSAEAARLEALHRAHQSWYEEHPEDALAMAGDLHHDGTEKAHIAALVATASILMNLDEFVTRE